MLKTIEEFKQLTTTSDLLEFLKKKGMNHNYYHHYTSLESVIKIIASEFFLLTRGTATCMNDQQECLAKGSQELWNQTYIGSFSYGDSENMAMWGLYSLPWEDAVRISIPKSAMLKWISGIDQVYKVTLPILEKEEISPLPRVVLSDIVYTNGKQNDITSKLYWNNSSIRVNENQFYGIDYRPEMTGFIKNDAWRYENEVRIHIQLQRDIQSERIGINIPPEVIDSLMITAGPYFSGDLLSRIAGKIPQVLNIHQVQESGFKRLVNYRTLCSMCGKEPFVRK